MLSQEYLKLLDMFGLILDSSIIVYGFHSKIQNSKYIIKDKSDSFYIFTDYEVKYEHCTRLFSVVFYSW